MMSPVVSPAMPATILPENLEESTVESMSVGDIAWIVPWGMWVDRQRRCWLNLDCKIRDSSGGTVQMRVERHHDGVRVWVPDTERWTLSRRPPHVGGDVEYLPVTEINTRTASDTASTSRPTPRQQDRPPAPEYHARPGIEPPRQSMWHRISLWLNGR